VAGRKRLQRIVNLLLIPRANLPIIHNLPVPVPPAHIARPHIGLTHRQEMRPQPTNQPFQKHLEHRRRYQRVQQPDDGVIHVPERADPDLHDEEDGDGDQGGEEGGRPDRDDFLAERVREFRVHDLAAVAAEVDGEGAGWGGAREIDTESYGALVVLAYVIKSGRGFEVSGKSGGAPIIIMVMKSSSVILVNLHQHLYPLVCSGGAFLLQPLPE
jgi:hypothetical protein